MGYKSIINRLVQRALELLYNPFAWAYDIVASLVSLGQWYTWVTSILPYIHGDTVLEIGFGTGHLQLAIQQNKPQTKIFGIDASWNMAQITKKRLFANRLNARLCNSYVQSTPFPSCAFDQVIITFPTNYFLDPNSLKEIYRLLRDNGNCISLLSVNFIGNHPQAKFLRFLYRVTGQSEFMCQHLQSLKDYIQSYHFKVTTHFIRHKYWQLTYIVMEKLPQH